jgi:hypothetical protein
MKEHGQLALGLISALFEDCAIAYPTLRNQFKRGEQRLLRQVDSRGLTVLTVELPDLGKHFDMCLSKDRFTLPNLPNSGFLRSGRSSQGLFPGLMDMVFDESGLARMDHDPTAVSLIRQITYCCKKLRLVCEPSKVFKTIKEFYHDESRLPIPANWWDDNHGPNPHYHTSVFTGEDRDDLFEPPREYNLSGEYPEGRRVGAVRTLQQVADRVAASFGEFIPEQSHAKHGPGAVADSFGLSKFEFPKWTARLDTVFPVSSFAVINDGFGESEDLAGAEPGGDLLRWNHSPSGQNRRGVVSSDNLSSKLICVPKTQKGPRLIASEPICNQYCQQAIADFLTTQMEKSLIGKSVTINDQRPSRKLALESSKTGSHITVDLSNASDRLSCWIVERAFRCNISLLRAFHAVRTPELSNDIDRKHPSKILLRKFAPMGAAVTFPVQSIVFAMLSLTAVLVTKGWTVSSKNIRRASRLIQVYGDDIIVPKSTGQVLFYLLEHLWLKVSKTKTFVEGNFRESCGMDAYQGYDVTPAYVLEPFDQSRPSSVSSVLEASNNFFSKGLWKAAQYLESTIPHKWRKSFPVVRYGEAGFGLRSFSGSSISHLKKRWNDDYQCYDRRVAILRTRSATRRPSEYDALFQWFSDEPDPQVKWIPGHVRRVTQEVGHAWTSTP